jgi:hypothetical protein
MRKVRRSTQIRLLAHPVCDEPARHPSDATKERGERSAKNQRIVQISSTMTKFATGLAKSVDLAQLTSTRFFGSHAEVTNATSTLTFRQMSGGSPRTVDTKDKFKTILPNVGVVRNEHKWSDWWTIVSPLNVNFVKVHVKR